MHYSRGPARFCQLKASKSAPLSWSGSFLLIKASKSAPLSWSGSFQKVHHSRGPARFCGLKASKSAPLSWSGLFLLIKSVKKCTNLVVRLPLSWSGSFLLIQSFKKRTTLVVRLVFSDQKFWKVHNSRGPARFCWLKFSKSAPLSWSGSFLLTKSFNKCTTLLVRLVCAD